MNEHDESEGIAPPVFWGLTPTLSDVRNISSQLRQCLVLPAALSWADFLPHARETESMPPQRRRLPAGLSQIHILRGRWDTFTLPAASMPTVPSSPGLSTRFINMKDNDSSTTDSDLEALGFGAGAMSETSQMSQSKPKRKTIFIKLHPKPYAPRNSAVSIRYLKSSVG